MARYKSKNQSIEKWVKNFCKGKSVAEIESEVIPFINDFQENTAKLVREFENFVYSINPYDFEKEAKEFAFEDNKLRDQEHDEAIEQQIQKTRQDLQAVGGYEKNSVFNFSKKAKQRAKLSGDLDFLTGKARFQNGRVVYHKNPQSNEKRLSSSSSSELLKNALDQVWGDGFFYAKAIYEKYKNELDRYTGQLSKYGIFPDGYVGTVSLITENFGRKRHGNGDQDYLFTYTTYDDSDRGGLFRNITLGGEDNFVNSDGSDAGVKRTPEKLYSLGFDFELGSLAPRFTEKKDWWTRELLINKHEFLKKVDEVISKEKATERRRYVSAMAASRSEEQRGIASGVRTEINYNRQVEKLATCPYCDGELGSFSGFNCAELDHIYPVSKGGLSTESNLVYVCKDCNREKGTETLNKFIQKQNISADLIHQNLDKLGKDY